MTVILIALMVVLVIVLLGTSHRLVQLERRLSALEAREAELVELVKRQNEFLNDLEITVTNP